MSAIVTVPNPLLRQKSKAVKKVTPAVLKLIKELKITLDAAADPKGVGLSAVQIGQPVRLFLARKMPADKPIIFINPRITWKSAELTAGVPKSSKDQRPPSRPTGGKTNDQIPEGCLSVPGFFGIVHRHKSIKLKYSTLKNNQQLTINNQLFSNFLATVIQHELDHLNGILFIDRVLEQGGKLYQEEEGKLVESSL